MFVILQALRSQPEGADPVYKYEIHDEYFTSEALARTYLDHMNKVGTPFKNVTYEIRELAKNNRRGAL